MLEKRAPQLIEEEKTAAILTGPKTSVLVNSVLNDFYVLKKPQAVRYTRKNEIRPFLDTASLEFLVTKATAALFLVGVHSKKRPHTIVLGRTFDGHVLDQFELQISAYKASADFPVHAVTYGNHPLILFQGGDWESGHELPVLRNMLLDYFRGDSQEGELNLGGVEHAVVFTAVDGAVHFRHYHLVLKNAGVRTPYVELAEVGPQISFAVKRTQLADAEARKFATRMPKPAKLPKNHERGMLGKEMGRVHLDRQNLADLERSVRRPKALRAKRSADDAGMDGASGKRLKPAGEATTADDV